MKTAVIDSSSLIFSLKTNRVLELLKQRYGCLFVPEAVYREVFAKEHAPEAMDSSALFSTGFLKQAASSKRFDDFLGEGESQSVSLAFEKKIQCICDDRKAFFFAKSIGVTVIPLSSFIVWSVRKKFLSKKQGEELLNELVKQGYYLKTSVYVKLLEEIREVKRFSLPPKHYA